MKGRGSWRGDGNVLPGATVRGFELSGWIVHGGGLRARCRRMPPSRPPPMCNGHRDPKGKGLYSGRANGDFNEPTRDALRAYQKSAGLKQTGQLDAATSGHMLAARQSAAPSSMGNLAGPNGKPQPSQVNRNVEPPKPLAAPTTRVYTHGRNTGVQALGVIGHSGKPHRAGQSGGHSAERSAAPPTPHTF